MIKITPSLDGLATITNPSEYSITLPSAMLNIRTAKNVSAVKTIDGGASVTVWDAKAAGERRTLILNLIKSDYEKLRRMVDYDVEEWIIRAGGKTYSAVLSMPFAMENKNTLYWRAELEIIITAEVSK
jgi:hypothetical protein